MAEYLTGTWEGIDSTGTMPAYAAYGGALDGFDLDLGIHRTSDIPARDFDVRLVIASQGAYKQFGAGPFPLVSIVAGEIAYLERGASAPVSGFVDDSGSVNLSIYESSPRDDRVFIGRLTHRGLMRNISGNITYRVAAGTSWAERYTSYYFGRLSVKNEGFGLDDRAYIVESRHVF